MNYKDFFKNEAVSAKLKDAPELKSVNPKELEMGEKEELEHTDDPETAHIIALHHLEEDPKYYSKLKGIGLEEEEYEEAKDGSDFYDKEEDVEEHCGACKDDFGSEYDFNNGLPKIGGALAVPHRGQPIMMGKVIQVGNEFGKGPASGELSGMTKAGVAKDTGGVPANQQGDKEPLTAGGKKLETSVASKSVGGPVSPGEGQKQGGPNSQGTIANTARLNENKNKVRKIVKEVLKEIKFDKNSGKWVKITEGKHKPGCKCAFCAKKGKFGKKSKEDVDENTVDMKMGPSYKTVQPRMYQTAEDDWARRNEYDPEITEMYDDEEECMMNERYVTLANAQRNLTESELAELKSLREKIDRIAEKKRTNKWIQKAVNPKHKGYCTPMSKPTCTPRRKALAKRFKAGIEEAGNEKEMDERKDKWIQKAVNPKHKGYCTPVTKATCTPRRKALAMRFKKGDIHKANVEKEEEGSFGPDRGDWEEVDENTVNMKMGPSYKVVQPRLYKTSEDDFARTNEYDPEVSESDEQEETFEKGMKSHFSPDWAEEDETAMDEAGIQAVQHSSYRTIDHGNLPQNGKQRWADDLDEASKKPSKVAKSIQKGMKPKTTLKNPKLKFQKPKKTTSGVHKRKP